VHDENEADSLAIKRLSLVERAGKQHRETLDVYGHLFPSQSDSEELATAANLLAT
jgi:hypothetical protein